MEVAMTDVPTLDPATYPGVQPETGGEPAARSHGLFILRGLQRLIARSRARDRFRSEIERKLLDDPHLIDDVGLSRRQIQEELAKPFWQVL
jgi:uncharacterized protein YjiS (DUF1127 family)